MNFGYARISTKEQDNQTQITVLETAGCERIFQEQASGGRWERPELHKMLELLREGDTLTVWKLDRLFRSLKDLIIIIEKIDRVGATFRSLTEAIDTRTAAGRMMMQMIGSFAEFERELIKERTLAGLKKARLAGRIGGRRSKLSRQQRIEIISQIHNGQRTQADMARLFNVHPSTISRIIN